LCVVPTHFPCNICTNYAVVSRLTQLFGTWFIVFIDFLHSSQHHNCIIHPEITTYVNIHGCRCRCNLFVTFHLLNELSGADSFMSRHSGSVSLLLFGDLSHQYDTFTCILKVVREYVFFSFFRLFYCVFLNIVLY